MISFWNIVRWMLITLLCLVFITQVVIRAFRRFHHFPVPGWMTLLMDNPIRRKFLQPTKELVERMSLESGMTVVEIGPGKGSYTEAVAERVLPWGKVYAIDVQESVVERLKKRIEEKGITNIFPRIDDAHHLSFEDNSVDRVLSMATLPEVPEPVKVLREFHRILKSDGLVCLVELFPDPDYPRRNTEKRWADEAGFELQKEFGNWFIYQLNFRKKQG